MMPQAVNGDSNFEVGVYNEKVREAVQRGERHKQLADSWADIHYIEITAPDESTARNKVSRRYPRPQGSVIDSLTKSKF